MPRKSKAASKELKEVVDLDIETEHAPTSEGKVVNIIKLTKTKREKKNKSISLNAPISTSDEIPLKVPKLKRSNAYSLNDLPPNKPLPQTPKTRRESLWSQTVKQFGSIASKTKNPDQYALLMKLYQKNKDKVEKK